MSNYLVYGKKTSLQQNMCLLVIMLGIYASTLDSSIDSLDNNLKPVANNIQSHKDVSTSIISITPDRLHSAGKKSFVNNKKLDLKKQYYFGVFMSFMTVIMNVICAVLIEAIITNREFVQTKIFVTNNNKRRSILPIRNSNNDEKNVFKKMIILPPPSRGIFTFYMSIFSLFYLLVYIMIFTVPNWETLVLDPIEAKGGDFLMVIGVYFLIGISGVAQNIGYIDVIMRKGSVFVGVITTLVTVIVFSGSNYFFCNFDFEQCGTLIKSMSCFVVVGGVLGFNLSESNDDEEAFINNNIVNKDGFTNNGIKNNAEKEDESHFIAPEINPS